MWFRQHQGTSCFVHSIAWSFSQRQGTYKANVYKLMTIWYAIRHRLGQVLALVLTTTYPVESRHRHHGRGQQRQPLPNLHADAGLEESPANWQLQGVRSAFHVFHATVCSVCLSIPHYCFCFGGRLVERYVQENQDLSRVRLSSLHFKDFGKPTTAGLCRFDCLRQNFRIKKKNICRDLKNHLVEQTASRNCSASLSLSRLGSPLFSSIPTAPLRYRLRVEMRCTESDSLIKIWSQDFTHLFW